MSGRCGEIRSLPECVPPKKKYRPGIGWKQRVLEQLFPGWLEVPGRFLFGGIDVQVKRKINGGDIDWALGAAPWCGKVRFCGV